jgi:hypothetical protein
MSVRHYPRNVQSRNDNIAYPNATVRGAGKHGPRNVQTAHDSFLQTRPDTNTTDVASTLWGY